MYRFLMNLLSQARQYLQIRALHPVLQSLLRHRYQLPAADLLFAVWIEICEGIALYRTMELVFVNVGIDLSGRYALMP